MAGVVNRDGVREAAARVLIGHQAAWVDDREARVGYYGFYECGCNEHGHLNGLLLTQDDVARHQADEVARVLDAVPDVPPAGYDRLMITMPRSNRDHWPDVPPDTPTADVPADDGLVEQVARIVHNSRSTIPMCGPESSGPCWPIARALVADRPWQAEVEAKALEDAANKARERDEFAADGVDIFLLKLADDIRKEHGLHPYRAALSGGDAT